MEGKGEKKSDGPPAPKKSVNDLLMGKKNVISWDFQLIGGKPNCFPPPQLWWKAKGASDIWEYARYTYTDTTKQASYSSRLCPGSGLPHSSCCRKLLSG
jgi:hypothetical protein